MASPTFPRSAASRLSLLSVVGALVWSSASAHAGPLTGTVLDAQTLQPVAGATVRLVASERSTTTDEAGAYRFDDVPEGTLIVRIEAVGYETTEESLVVPADGLERATFVLVPPGAAAEVIEVTGSGPALPKPPGKTDLVREEFTRIPGTRGDALTALKSLPGVANADAAGQGPGLLVIRGAAPEDSKVTLDGIEVPLLYHFFGLQSIVPSEFVDTIDYLPGGFGAEEGRATGGVISISTRAEEVEHAAGFAELSFINLAAFVQTPISKEHHVQLSAAFRRSTIDMLLPLAIPDDAAISFTTAPQYYDAQVRVDWRPDYKNRVSLLGLVSFDLLTLLNDALDPNEPLLTGKWENETSFTRAILTWKRATDRLENRLVFAPGTTGFRFEIGEERFLRLAQSSLELRDDLLWRAHPRVQLRVGGDLRYITNDARTRFPLAPQEGTGGPGNFSSSPVLELSDTITNHTAAAYTIVDIKPSAQVNLSAGLRLDHYDRIDATTVSPRLHASYKLADDIELRLALGSYSRHLQRGEALQENLKPEYATQYVLGGDYDIARGLELSLSGFYTDRHQLVVQDPYTASMDPANAYVNRGYGRSYGIETLLRARREQFFGWISYTLSRSDRIDGPIQPRRLFDYDQTHNVIVVGSYTWGAWEFGGRWQYNTGSPLTPVVDSIYLADLNVYVPEYGAINSTRLRAAHQLDLRVDRRWRFRHWSLSAYVDVTNVYANPRTLGYRYNFDFSQREAIEELPLVPALGVRGSF